MSADAAVREQERGGFATGGVVPGYARGDDAIPVFLDGCGYLLPPEMVRELIAQLPPVPPAHP